MYLWLYLAREERDKSVVLQCSTHQRNIPVNLMAVERSLLRTNRKRREKVMSSFVVELCRSIVRMLFVFHFKM